MKKSVRTIETTGLLLMGPMTGEVIVEPGRAGTSTNKTGSSSTNIIPIDFERGAARRVLSGRATIAYPPVMQKCGEKAGRFPEK